MKKSIKKKLSKPQFQYHQFLNPQLDSNSFILQKDKQDQNFGLNHTQQEMLVSYSETQSFKLDFLISSYEDLIKKCKLIRKEFIECMKTQMERHHNYYNEIMSLVRKTQESTKEMLKQKLEQYSSLFGLKISFLNAKVNSLRRVLFEPQREKKRVCYTGDRCYMNNGYQIDNGCLIEKGSSYEGGVDFDVQLRELYSLKEERIGIQFIENEEVQQSLQRIKGELIRGWEKQQQKSVSFSSVSWNQQKQNTFSQELFKLIDSPDSKIKKINSPDTQIENNLFPDSQKHLRSSKFIYSSNNQTDTTSKIKTNFSLTPFNY